MGRRVYRPVPGRIAVTMTALQHLRQSSPETRAWLGILREHLPSLEYRESGYWASFRVGLSGTAIAYLNPSKSHIRLFLQLSPLAHDQLKPAPSTKSWKERFPAIYEISSENDLQLAVEFILWSFVLAARPKRLDLAPAVSLKVSVQSSVPVPA